MPYSPRPRLMRAFQRFYVARTLKPGLYFLELPPVIDAGRSERAAPVTMSATALAATSVRSFVALAIWSPASFAASRALATCGLSDLLTRAAAAALAAATSALAKISRPRSELTRLSSAFVSVFATVTPITFVGAEALVLAALVFVARFFEGGALAARLFDVVERVFAERVLAAFAIRDILLRLIVPHPGRHGVKLSVAGKIPGGPIPEAASELATAELSRLSTGANESPDDGFAVTARFPPRQPLGSAV